MAWCFSARASVATGLSTHPSVSSCLWIKAWWWIYASVNWVIISLAWGTCRTKPLPEPMLSCFHLNTLKKYLNEILWHETHMEISSAKCRPFCSDLTVLKVTKSRSQLHTAFNMSLFVFPLSKCTSHPRSRPLSITSVPRHSILMVSYKHIS